MANRMYNQFQGTLEKGVVQLFLELSFPGGTGVPTLVKSAVNGGCKGVVSPVVRTGTGVYEITLQDSYVRLLGFSEGWKNASASPNIGQFVLTTDAVATATPKLTFTAYSQATTPVAADVAAGNTLFLTLALSNSTAL